MKVQLKFFATLRDRLRDVAPELEVAPGTTAREVFERLFPKPSEARAFLTSTRFAVNWEYVSSATVLHDGDEVAFIPPVCGG